jgi:hypothetical protein
VYARNLVLIHRERARTTIARAASGDPRTA